MNRNFLITVTLLLFLTGCNFNYSSQAQDSDDTQTNGALQLAKNALSFIKNSKLDSLKNLLEPSVLSRVKPEQLDWLMNEGKAVIDKSTYPLDSSIITSQSVNYSLTGKTTVDMFSFPFQNVNYEDSIKYFHITIANNKIHRLLLNDHPPGMRIIEPSNSEPHKTNLNLQTDNLSWFRIWYDGGKVNNKKYQNETGFYAVSGNLENLDKTGARDKFQRIFDLLNNAEFDSLDFQYLRDREVGNPEWIYLRMKFDGEYKELGEFEISYFISEEEGKKEVMSDYVIFKHTDKTRYLLRKGANTELVTVLTEIGRYDFDGFYERNP
tara:strand:- start:177 stop:1145 length:969 start_codon:yes stop_codon:yes gene_type:complete